MILILEDILLSLKRHYPGLPEVKDVRKRLAGLKS